MEALPTGEEIIERLIKVRNLKEEDTEDLRLWLFTSVRRVQAEITKYITNSEFKTDPEAYLERLYKYHYIMGGLSGLATALYDKVFVISYKKLTETSRSDSAVNKQKLTAGDRDTYAKDDSADLKGLKLIIDETIKNIETRLYGSRSSSKRW